MSRFRERWQIGLVAGGIILAGCYTFRPLGGATPEVGTKVAFDVNDVGRVALGGSAGPEIAQIEGQLVERDSTSYLLAVSSVRLLGGGEQIWKGEPVRVRLEHVVNAYERRFSLGRSIALGAAGVGGFAAFMVTRSLLGSGTEDNKPPDDTATTRLGRP